MNHTHPPTHPQIVYHTASVGIVMQKDPRTQDFHVEHTDDVVSLAVFSQKGRTLVATGQVGE